MERQSIAIDGSGQDRWHHGKSRNPVAIRKWLKNKSVFESEWGMGLIRPLFIDGKLIGHPTITFAKSPL